jgi:hypothetical protein
VTTFRNQLQCTYRYLFVDRFVGTYILTTVCFCQVQEAAAAAGVPGGPGGVHQGTLKT